MRPTEPQINLKESTLVATDDKRLTLTPEETFEVIGCGRSLGYELLRTGKIPHIRLSKKKIVIPRKALEEMLANAK